MTSRTPTPRMVPTSERLAVVENELKHLNAAISTLVEQGAAAAESRKQVYATQEKTAKEIIHIHNRLDTLESSVDAIRPTTEEYKLVRNNVVFAGRLGQTLWSVGKALLSAAAGAAAAWYALTGRPPP